MDLSVLHQITYGMYVVGVNDNGRPAGCVINTLCQITSENPTIAISMNKNNYTFAVIERTKRFSISILSEDTNPNIIAGFGFRSGKDTDKFAGTSYTMEDNLPLLREAFCGGLLCDVISMTDMETHMVIIARLRDTIAGTHKNPMTYSYYHRVIKGKAPKNAPTYQEEKESDSANLRYTCSVCGWVYEGDINREPEDYVCPICGAPKSAFKKL